MSKRIGLYGGSFDPVHHAHLTLAEQAREQLRLDEVRFVPNNVSPFKADRTPTLGKKRAEMLEAATAGNPAFTVSRVEVKRAGPSYTADTVGRIAADEPEAELFLLLGADSLPQFPRWHEPQRIVARCRLAVAPRPGHPPDYGVLADLLDAGELRATAARTITMPLLAISSRDLRRRVAQGRSIRYLVPPAVEAYIAAAGFYREEAPAG